MSAEPTQAGEITTDDLAEAGIHLDPARAEAARQQRAIVVNTRVYPRLRIAGVQILVVVVLIHNVLILRDPRWQDVALFALVAEAFALGSWLLLRRYYRPRPPGVWDLADWLFLAELLVWAAAVYAAGATRSWLFFLFMLRVADQVHGGARRALIFAHAATAAYGLVIAAAVLDGLVIDPFAEAAKLTMLWAGGAYIAVVSRPAEELRTRTAMAVRFAGDLIGRLEQRTVRLAEETRRAELLRAEAESASAARARLLSRVSHEFRTPLNHILGFAQLLRMTHLADEERDSVTEIERGGRRLLDLVDRVLLIADAERETVHNTPSRARCEPAPLVRDVLARLGDAIAEKGLRVETWGLDEPAVTVAGDARRVEEIIWSVVSNAVLYNRRNGRLGVGLEPTEDYVRIVVEDSGPGLGEEELLRAYEPFERLDADRDEPEGSGRGLGLTLARALIHALGGRIAVVSEPDVGSRFSIELPRAGVATAADEPGPLAVH